ncbi:MAG: hypothetical protein HY808_14570 [Nitrospirae bacterium]|nr:hypothetical protein [Nitrospirota bacterium]
MVALNSCEVIDELKKLGIEINEDLLEYLKEYSTYYTSKDDETSSGNDKK